MVAAWALAWLLALGAGGATARAAGGSPSSALAHHDLYVASGARLSAGQQTELGTLLAQARSAGLPLRVAILAHRSDLGAASRLWGQPQSYARQLSSELAPGYRGRLLVVTPAGLGVAWPGHATASAARALRGIATGSGAGQLVSATDAAVGSLAADAGDQIGDASASGSTAGSSAPPAQSSAAGSGASAAGSGASAATSPGQGTDTVVAAIVAGLVALAAAGWVLRRVLRRQARAQPAGDPAARHTLALRRAVPGVAVLCGIAVLVPVVLLGNDNGNSSAPASTEASGLATNPNLDPGQPLHRAAPDFTLTDQFGRHVSLSSFRGKVVLLAFTDSECTTVCPLTTQAMVDAKAMLGPAASRVQLLGIDANPDATAVRDVASYSQLHGMMRSWNFLTGSVPQLKRVWHDYGIAADIIGGQIDHTPALFVIGPNGQEGKVYMTQMSYTAVGQLGQLVAQEASSLLPDHPRVNSHLSYAAAPSTPPSTRAEVPRVGGGSLSLGPGRAHLYLFFATWDREVTDLAAHLDTLNRYAATAARSGLPPLTAIDEGSVEPSAGALPTFLHTLRAPLSYPVGIDTTGRLGDGYGAIDEPWLVATSPTGKILWYQDVSTDGWPKLANLVADVRGALAKAPAAPTSVASAARELAGSPAPLAALHGQAAQLVGGEPALAARIKALRGYPIVLNAWASWCTPCQEEFGLFRAASARYGRRVAFLGADTNDDAGNAQAFLKRHPVSYPSYRATSANLSWLAAVGDLPTTVFISPQGKVTYVHTGQYVTQGSLDGDVTAHALGQG